jgi:hypothetical protein
MSDAGTALIELPAEPGAEAGDGEEVDVLGRRDRDLLAGRGTKKLRDNLDDIFSAVHRAFEDQRDRADDIEDYWDCFNCRSNSRQYYSGIANIYFPIIHDAVKARETRFSNQMCPQSGRFLEVVSADGTQPQSLIGLLEHYLREVRFETQVLKPLCRMGDIEGQYNLYVDWCELEREIVSRETHGPRVPMDGGGEVEAPGDEMEDVKSEVIREGMPVFEVLHDCDVGVWPANVDSLDEAFSVGGGVAIVRHWTKAKIDKLIDQGAVRKTEGKDLKDSMDKVSKDNTDIEKHLAEEVGIHAKGTGCTVWEVWTCLPLDKDGGFDEDGSMRLCRIFFGPNRAQLGAKRNPYWNDRCPLLSVPIEKTPGVFKGKSLISYVDSLQYEANDAVNEGADAATLSAAPIVLRDPEKSNGPLVFGVGAIWDGGKDAISLLTFPDLTPRAQTRVQMALAAIFQSLGVNPSMLPQQTRAGKPSQAMVAQEQAVDLLTTAEGVKVPVEGLLTPMLGLVVDYDYQFRDTDLTVRQFGEMGVRARLEQVPPLTNRAGYTFIWRGAEQVKQSMMMQQGGTAWMNVMMQPAMQAALAKAGYEFDPAPLVIAQNQNLFGAFLGSQVLINQRELLTMKPEEENQILLTGQHLHVHPLDQDPQHMQAHAQAMQMSGDPFGTIAEHMAAHVQSMQMKIQASMQKAQAQQGMPPGGGPGRQGGGQPQPGARPGLPHAAKGPPGTMHPDSGPAAGVIAMPRRN